MAALAPVPAAASAEVARIAPLKLPVSGGAALPDARAGQPERGADQITLAPPPTARTLIDLATSGLRQLGTLLPALERIVGDAALDPSSPVGHLARALGDAAHAIDIGAAAMPAGKESASPATADAWRQTATGALHDAADLLVRAEQRLNPTQPQSAKTQAGSPQPASPQSANLQSGSPSPAVPSPAVPSPAVLSPAVLGRSARPPPATIPPPTPSRVSISPKPNPRRSPAVPTCSTSRARPYASRCATLIPRPAPTPRRRR